MFGRFLVRERNMNRWRWVLTGAVQGVGFRPFVYKTAQATGVTGQVANTSSGVVVEIQGSMEDLAAFEDVFTANLPPLARIATWKREILPPRAGETGFHILPSTGGAGHQVLISPDVAVCADCLKDLRDPANRRHGYAFTNCTNCGPRYTIIRSIPYDRASTSMSCFPLCAECRKEYENPLDRRFHAQPNACPVCGPRLWLTDGKGIEIAENNLAMERAAYLLSRGEILAMKGLGGFHLACDARNQNAVELLRQRKKRPDKPLAIMLPDLETVRHLCIVSRAEETLLSGMERPIVLLRAREHTGLAPGLSPDTAWLGVMLSYTPLHHVLFAALPFGSALVMTSGNAVSEPICLGNREALRRIRSMAGYFLLHDRDILVRCDDSVLRCVDETPQFIRRARGYTPAPVDLGREFPPVLGTGALLKNTVCLLKGGQAFVSQHIGDLENMETQDFFEETIAHLTDILQVSPAAVVHDLHPDFPGTRYARRTGLPCFSLQHHFAHIYAALAENRLEGKVVGLALDGAGLGTDGTIWGGEALLVDGISQERLGRFSLVRQPGGDEAVREPWRMGRAYLYALGVMDQKSVPWLEQYAPADAVVVRMLERGLNAPWTSSCGRLFDAVAALLGLCRRISYEGQAAIRLEAMQDKSSEGVYRCPLIERDGLLELDTLELFAQVYGEWHSGVPAPVISRRFHMGLVAGLDELAFRLCREYSCQTVALSGGVMHNMTIARRLPRALEERGLRVLTHKLLPPGDGCVSLGQAFYGSLVLTTSSERT